MEFKEFPNEFSLRYQVLVLCVFSDSILNFATDIADNDLENLSDDEKEIYNTLADYFERAAHQAEKLRKRMRGR